MRTGSPPSRAIAARQRGSLSSRQSTPAEMCAMAHIAMCSESPSNFNKRLTRVWGQNICATQVSSRARRGACPCGGRGQHFSRAGETVARSTDTRRILCSGHKRDLKDPSPALLDGCNGLRTRSLKPRRVAVSNRPTVTPLSRARHLHEVQTESSVTIRPPIATPAQGVSHI
jgi:hypothetical protein